MSNYKTALNKLEEENKANIKNSCVKEHDLYCGLADEIIENHWKKEDKKWKVEYAKEIIKKECKK